jgi:hypothetical protein
MINPKRHPSGPPMTPGNRRQRGVYHLICLLLDDVICVSL